MNNNFNIYAATTPLHPAVNFTSSPWKGYLRQTKKKENRKAIFSTIILQRLMANEHLTLRGQVLNIQENMTFTFSLLEILICRRFTENLQRHNYIVRTECNQEDQSTYAICSANGDKWLRLTRAKSSYHCVKNLTLHFFASPALKAPPRSLQTTELRHPHIPLSRAEAERSVHFAFL